METKHLILNDRLFRIVLFTAALVVIIAGTIMAETFVTLMLLSFFISIIAAHPVAWLDKKKIPHVLSVIIVLLSLLILIGVLSGAIGSAVSNFTSNLGKYESRLTTIMNSINQELGKFGIQLSDKEISKQFSPAKILGFTAVALGQLGNVMSNATLIFFIVLFALLEMDSISLKWKVFGAAADSRTRNNLNKIEKNIQHFLVRKTLTSLIEGVLIFGMFSVVGVQYAALWGLLAFLFNYIPYLGALIVAVPSLLFAFIQLGFISSFWAGVGYLSVHLFVGYLLEPRVLGSGILSALVVFLSLIIWGYLLGVVGMFLSVPLTMTLKTILDLSPSTRPLGVLLGTKNDAEDLIKKL